MENGQWTIASRSLHKGRQESAGEVRTARIFYMEQVQRNASGSRIESLNEGHIINDGQAAIDILKSPDYTIKDKVVDWLRYYHILSPMRGPLY